MSFPSDNDVTGSGEFQGAEVSSVYEEEATQPVHGGGGLALPACLEGKRLDRAQKFDGPGSHFYVAPDALCLVEAVVFADSKIDLDDVLGRIEVKMIQHVLDKSGGSKARAARMLGISRSRLYRRMHALGLDDSAEEPEAAE